MEQIIIIALIIVIVMILLNRKFSITIREKDNGAKTTNLPSIMGGTKQRERHSLPIDSNEGQNDIPFTEENNFESETEGEEFENVYTAKNLDEILVKNENWHEDEDWKYQHSNIESGFATGVTFQELSTAGQLLQQKMLEPDLEQQAVDIIQKIQGTELFDLLESSLGDASKRIGSLLKESISNEDEIFSSKRSNSTDSFDIGEFV
ncbi:hypothetical protein [Chryseobacterium sp. 2987]|uniref:hypothetical protein n=1 Tax=Chryseobacterium sp. 2987 TaxID=2817767 RepID=UPI00286496EC|nr:hypothetical protein [Chryseobacterium sp. 2987]MDR6920012.1 hypothetical protein [Chryseobacterium sp. 2987]